MIMSYLALYTGWHIRLIQSSVLVWGPCTTKTQPLFWCQRKVWINLNGHPVEWTVRSLTMFNWGKGHKSKNTGIWKRWVIAHRVNNNTKWSESNQTINFMTNGSFRRALNRHFIRPREPAPHSSGGITQPRKDFFAIFSVINYPN